MKNQPGTGDCIALFASFNCFNALKYLYCLTSSLFNGGLVSKNPAILILFLLFIIIPGRAVQAVTERPGELPERLAEHGSARNGGWKFLRWGMNRDQVEALAKEKIDILGTMRFDSSPDRFNHDVILYRRVEPAINRYFKVKQECMGVTSFLSYSDRDPDDGHATFHFLGNELIGVDISIPKQVDSSKLLRKRLMVDYGGKVFRTSDGTFYIANNKNSSVYAQPHKIIAGRIVKKGVIEFLDPSVWRLEQACVEG